MDANVERAARFLVGARLERKHVVGAWRQRAVRFGEDWEDSEPPTATWAAWVAAETGALELRAFFGWTKPRIYTGDAAFDRDVCVVGNLPQAIVSLLEQDVRLAILHHRINVRCSPGCVHVSRGQGDWPYSVTPPVEAMIDLGAHLAERISVLLASGHIPRKP